MTDLSVGIIGAGPGGLALGIMLSRAGFRDFTIFDREDGVGGTWRINTYPGLACDVKSHLYSFSFDLNAHWSRLWSGQPEILDYFQRSADKHGLGPHLKLRTEIRSARWDSDTQRWCLTTATGEQHHFNVVVSAVGLFTRPLMPDLVEEEPFTGTVMHSSRWDHSIPLEGKKIAVLGTGSTASQLIPELAKVAGTVYSVQRSPTWILPKPDRHYTRAERWAFAHLPFAKKVYRTRLWLRSESNIAVIEHGSEKTEQFTALALRLLEKTVDDEELRRKLTPDHPMGCKRLVFSSDYLPALTRPNVEVLTSPARSLRARSLVTEDGTERAVDLVVCATGYAAADYLGELDVSGEHGITLRQVWRDGAHAYLAWPCRISPISSCCTGRTPTSAPTASSSSSKPRRATSCGRCGTFAATANATSRCVPRRWPSSSPRSTAGWWAPSGPPSAATTSAPPTGAWSPSGRAAPEPSGG